jgi:tripartite-type tricarboxylate transporter receptor subunit TctC
MFHLLRLFVSIFLVATSVVSAAQPDQTIKLIVGFPPGTGNDLAARQVAKDITEGGGPIIIVENKVGAAGNIAVAEVVNTKVGDTPKLLLHSNSIYVNSYLTKTSNFNLATQLKPISFVGTVPMVLETGAGSEIYTLADIVRSKRNLSYGSGGVGALTHTNMAYISYILATPMLHVPYQGVAKSLPDLATGRIDLCFDFYNSSRAFIQDGRLRAIAVTGNHRLADLPNVPTLKEKGIDWPLESFYVLFGSTNIDPVTLSKMQNILDRAYVKNKKSYELQGIHPDAKKNKDIEQFNKETIKHYQNLKVPMNVNTY